MTHFSDMRLFFENGNTLKKDFRLEQLKKLKAAILKNEEKIYDALFADLGKSKEESWITEIGLVLSEINYAIKNLSKWMRPKKVSGGLTTFPSSGKIYKEPLGIILIIAPWNYPFQLSLNPLVGAIAAGNCAIVKPSEVAMATEKIIAEIISETFDENNVRVVTGDGATVISELMNAQRFDHIFYTGSTRVGKKIYQMAAENLVPVTLELGGKSPCIVEADADLKIAAKRIVFGKLINAGQTCIAPDHLLIEKSVAEKLLKLMVQMIQNFYGENSKNSKEYGRIINAAHFNRLLSYLDSGKIYFGGEYDKEMRWIAPTIITDVVTDSTIMKEEIFGPILPVIIYENKEDAVKIIQQNPAPLSFYLFTNNKQSGKDWIEKIPFGGGCINNTLYHYANKKLPFGGIGDSGIGRYHGKYSFDVFTHQKSVLKSGTWLDPAMKYPPFSGKLSLFKKIIK